MMQKPINLMNFDRPMMRDYFLSIGQKAFRGDQMIQWIHQYGVIDFDQMTNLSQPLREFLQSNAVIQAPKVSREQQSNDGTRKWLLELYDHEFIEMVFIPEEGRGTLCVSSQVGCPLKCRFCTTGLLGFKRNLTVSEIIGQVWCAVRLLSQNNGRHDRHVTNIVLMGMGEPLLNFDNVLHAISLMEEDLAYGLSKYRVTLSTSGIVPEMKRLSQMSDIALAVSLHAPNDTLRNQLMPINQKYPLSELIAACKEYFPPDSKRKVSFEYIMLDGINDQPEQADALIKLLQGVPCKVNLIPFNDQSEIHQSTAKFRCSTPDAISLFHKKLMRAGINTITRKTRGADIKAACGQLAGDVN